MTTFFLDRAKSVAGIPATAVSSVVETQCGVVDHTGFRSLLIIVDWTASSGNTLLLKLYEGSGGTAATAVTLDPLSAPVAISTTTTGQTLYQVDVSGFNQDVQASLTTSTTTAVTISANYILVDGNDNPALGVGNQVIPIRKKVM